MCWAMTPIITMIMLPLHVIGLLLSSRSSCSDSKLGCSAPHGCMTLYKLIRTVTSCFSGCSDCDDILRKLHLMLQGQAVHFILLQHFSTLSSPSTILANFRCNCSVLPSDCTFTFPPQKSPYQMPAARRRRSSLPGEGGAGEKGYDWVLAWILGLGWLFRLVGQRAST